jgi:DNA-binding transcriptional LysR family regulator
VSVSLVDHLEKLSAFAAVAREKSLSRAAETLHLAQPSLSHAVKVLEATLGTELFVRTPRGMELTTAGQKLFAFSEKLLTDVVELESQLRFSDDSVAGRIEVGTKEPYAVHLWPRYLESLRERHPLLEVQLHIERSNDALLEALAARRYDVVLVPEPETTASVRAYEVFRDRYDLYTSARVEKIDPNTSPLLCFQNAMSGGKLTLGQRLKKRRLPFARVQEISSFEAARAMAIQGLGVAVLPRSIAEGDVREGKLKRACLAGTPDDLFAEMKVCLCLHVENARSPKLRALLRHLKRVSLD